MTIEMANQKLTDLKEWQPVEWRFKSFQHLIKEDNLILSFVELGYTINELKNFFYELEYEYLWNNMVAILYENEKSVKPCSLEELNCSFEQIYNPSIKENGVLLSEISNFTVMIDRYSRNFNLNIRNLIRTVHSQESKKESTMKII